MCGVRIKVCFVNTSVIVVVYKTFRSSSPLDKNREQNIKYPLDLEYSDSVKDGNEQELDQERDTIDR